MIRREHSLLAGVLVLVVALARTPLGAQGIVQEAKQPRYETRAELEAAARVADSEHRGPEAVLLRARLQRGDFQEGDKILLSIDIPGLTAAGEASPVTGGAMDTVVLRAGKVLEFAKVPNIPDISLEGVLRSELVDTLTAHLAKYLRHPTVRAVPLLRIAVMGAVTRPGWYSARGDMVLADVIMQAGGVGPESEVQRTVIRRAGEVIWDAADVRAAIADGLSLDRLHLRAGDEVFVTPKRQWNVTTTLQVLAGLLGALVAVRALKSH